MKTWNSLKENYVKIVQKVIYIMINYNKIVNNILRILKLIMNKLHISEEQGKTDSNNLLKTNHKVIQIFYKNQIIKM